MVSFSVVDEPRFFSLVPGVKPTVKVRLRRGNGSTATRGGEDITGRQATSTVGPVTQLDAQRSELVVLQSGIRNSSQQLREIQTRAPKVASRAGPEGDDDEQVSLSSAVMHPK